VDELRVAVEKVLHLNLHMEFFDAIREGRKLIEYRDRTDYWARRLDGRDYDVIVFRSGYSTDAPEMQVESKGVRKVVRNGRPQYVIKLGRVLDAKR
jgi:ASC-1-like (ASCH) protein